MGQKLTLPYPTIRQGYFSIRHDYLEIRLGYLVASYVVGNPLPNLICAIGRTAFDLNLGRADVVIE
jgi:hypothetical protein